MFFGSGTKYFNRVWINLFSNEQGYRDKISVVRKLLNIFRSLYTKLTQFTDPRITRLLSQISSK
jgi:hypothetical protein